MLKISYDSLEDDHDKNLFLDIACLFVGKDRDYTTMILDGCDFYTTIGIENLIGRSLLFVNEKNKLMMHQMVRDMGREIIRQESPDLGKRSRLWHRDALDVIREKNGSKTIMCLTLDLQGLLEDKSRRTTSSLHFAKNSKNPFLMSNEEDFETEAFAKMQRLKLLQLDYVKVKGDFKDFPKGLIWLRWHGFPLQSLPRDFHINRLVVLDMRNSSLKHVWKNTECLPNLKTLNLNHSHGLLKTPNFSRLPSLEKLMLKDCIKLLEVDQSIGEIKTLSFLNLKDCKSLRNLPRTIGSLVSLEELILSGCSRLDDLPKELQNMKSLRVLNLDETAIYQSRFWFPWLSLRRSKELGFIWASLPCSLVKLSLESCRLSNNMMPNDLSSLPSLKSLNLSKNPIHSLPRSICSLTKLDELLLTSCTELQVIPKLPILGPLFELCVAFSPLTIGLSSIPCLMCLKRCIIFGCEKLIEVEGVFKLEPTENFEMEQIKTLFNIDSIDSNKVQLYNYLTDIKVVATPQPQVIQECGITSLFVQGSEVPIWFEYRNKGPLVTFSLPVSSHPGEKINWFTLCIVYSVSDHILEYIPCVYIFNKTKDITRAYYSTFIGIPETNGNNNTMLWLIHWPAMPFQFEGGDSLSFTIAPFDLDIREFGVTCGSENKIRYEYDYQHYYPGNEEHATRNIELELTEDLHNLGLHGMFKQQIYNNLEESKTVASPQVLYDCGILIGEFDLANYFPFHDYYGHYIPKPKISFTVPPNCSRKISGLKSIIVFGGKDDKTFDFFPRVEIVNETKGTKWSHGKHFVGIPEAKNTIISWLSCWKFRDELEAGDRMNFTMISDLHVLENGIDLVYDYETIDDNINLDHKYSNSLHQYSRGMTKCSSQFAAYVAYLFFKSQKTLWRMSSVKE
ncbi:hypothetical protein REPUB_Repub16aG0057100 [Reevesia pubescens]